MNLFDISFYGKVVFALVIFERHKLRVKECKLINLYSKFLRINWQRIFRSIHRALRWLFRIIAVFGFVADGYVCRYYGHYCRLKLATFRKLSLYFLILLRWILGFYYLCITAKFSPSTQISRKLVCFPSSLKMPKKNAFFMFMMERRPKLVEEGHEVSRGWCDVAQLVSEEWKVIISCFIFIFYSLLVISWCRCWRNFFMPTNFWEFFKSIYFVLQEMGSDEKKRYVAKAERYNQAKTTPKVDSPQKAYTPM